MDKTVAGLIGAVTALAAAAPSHAATPVPLTMNAAMQASSYADLLSPIPNARALLEAAAAAEISPDPIVSTSGVQSPVQDVQYYYRHHHHHHHRHHRHYYHHHHHHHYY